MFSRLVGHQPAKEILSRMLTQRRVPGALLFAGEDGVGKKLFAVELAKAFNCLARAGDAGGEACDRCASCAKIDAATSQLTPQDPDDDGIVWLGHRDLGLVRAPKRVLKVVQMREVERESNFRPFEGAARVFIVDEAEKLNDESSNALLKTLEEPHPTSHLILVTSRPASLLPTIRSRCQTIRFAPLAADEIESYLVKARKRAGEEARLTARLARGRLGVALEFNLDQYRARRDSMMIVLEALAGGAAARADRVALLRAAEELSDAKRKDDYEPRLEVLETLVHDLWLLALDASGAKIVNEDLRDKLLLLREGVGSRRASGWLSRVEELRGQLAVNVNRRVATDALFLAMAEER